MKVYFSQPEFDGQLLRALTYVPSGGADLGECLTTAARIKEGDFDSWYQEWSALGDRKVAEGEQALQEGHSISARNAFLRASNYYRASMFFLCGAPVDPRVIDAYDKHVDTFKKAAELLPWYAEEVQIPYKGTYLPGYFYKASNDTTPRPTIITFPGYDSSHQECYFSVAAGALERGFNVLCFDGPGQGELLIKQQVYMTHQWDEVVTAAVDFLLTQQTVNADAIVLIGSSWGGMLAPLAAAKEHRLAALICSPGQYEALQGIKKALPQVESLLQEDNHAVLDQILSQILADKMIAAKFKYKMWVHGVDTALDLVKEWTHYTLAGHADKISCPTFVIDFENETFSGGQAKQLYDALNCPKDYTLCKNGEGAGEHCGIGALTLINQRMFDWLENTLNHSTLTTKT